MWIKYLGGRVTPHLAHKIIDRRETVLFLPPDHVADVRHREVIRLLLQNDRYEPVWERLEPMGFGADGKQVKVPTIPCEPSVTVTIGPGPSAPPPPGAHLARPRGRPKRR